MYRAKDNDGAREERRGNRHIYDSNYVTRITHRWMRVGPVSDPPVTDCKQYEYNGEFWIN